MARIGILKTYPAGAFDAGAIPAIFGYIKTAFADAGFTVFNESATQFEALRHGVSAGTVSDDEPHWAFLLEQTESGVWLKVESVHGLHRDDPAARKTETMPFHSDAFFVAAPEVTFRFAADSAPGWWWLNLTPTEPDEMQAMVYGFTFAGATSRRYPADRHQGIVGRYGVWNHRGDWGPPYARNPDGGFREQPWFGSWSMLGFGWSNNGRRWAGANLPRMAVPQFPTADNGVAAGILGEYNEVLVLTDGYAFGEEVVPGWMAITASTPDNADVALPAPPEFVPV